LAQLKQILQKLFHARIKGKLRWHTA